MKTTGKRRFWKGIKWVGIAFLSFFFVFLLMMGMVFIASQTVVLKYIMALLPQDKLNGVNIMIFGLDNDPGVKRSDTIVVLHLDTYKKRIGVLSIPRDTRVYIPNRGLDKINHAYAYGGSLSLKETVSHFLSIPIHYYVKLHLENVNVLVNALGGVDLTLEKDLHYVDKAGDLYIDLKKGSQNLDGEKALQYLRYRHDNEGDIGRIRRQQTFLKAMMRKALELDGLLDFGKFISGFSRGLETNLGKREWLILAYLFKESFQLGHVESGTVPGALSLIDGVSYWRPDIIGMDRVIDEVLLGFDKFSEPIFTKIETPDPKASQDARRYVTLKEVHRVLQKNEKVTGHSFSRPMKVEVLNGYGGKYVATELVRHLRESGMHVFNYGNAGTFSYDETLIVDWKGNIQDSVMLAQMLSIDSSKIIVYDRSDKKIDATIVLGRDWEAIKNQFYKKQGDLVSFSKGKS